MRIRSWMVGMVLAGLFVSAASGAGLEKKLINFGWDMRTPSQLADEIGKLQRLPFDGLTVRAYNSCYAFFYDIKRSDPDGGFLSPLLLRRSQMSR